MAHNKYEVTTKTPVPKPVSKTGTVSSNGTTVKGSSTDFQDEVSRGDFIWSSANGEVRRIESISFDEQTLVIDSAFTAALSSEALEIVPHGEWRNISIKIVGSADGDVDGVTVPSGEVIGYDSMGMKTIGQRSYVEPYVVDGTVSKALVQEAI